MLTGSLARRYLICDKCIHILCYRVSQDMKRRATSTAQPIQSKPGPKLAIVAGANAIASLATGCLTGCCEASALHDNCKRVLRENLLLTLHSIWLGALSFLSCSRLALDKHFGYGC